jgi:guanylate kinase
VNGKATGAAEIKRRGIMFVLSSPSGAGKTTISRRLLDADTGIAMSVSCTTRPMRPGEVEGRDYHFVTETEFARRRDARAFLEHATVFGHSYATPRAPVDASLALGRDVLFDIDWQGTQQLKDAAREDVVSVFILPPSWDELERRLKTRAQDSDDVVARRMAKATDEISHWAEYDYIVVNRDIEQSAAEVRAILGAERLRRQRQTGLSAFVQRLLAERS